MSKNNFGTTNFYIGIYRGLNGNMTDTRDVLQTLGTQTAVVDNMTLFVNITITAIGVNGSYYWTILPINKAVSLTGFGIQTGQNAFRSGTVSNVDLSIPSQQWGISFQSQTGTPTILIPFVSVKAFNLS
jgi:hypothetical protein